MRKVDKVVFIPIQLLDSAKDDLVRRFEHILAQILPTHGIRDAIGFGRYWVAPVTDTRLLLSGGTLRDVRIRPEDLP